MWMKLHAINQLTFITGLILLAGLRLCTTDVKDCLLACATALVVFNCLIEGLWLVIGCVLFWGKGNHLQR